MFTMRNNKTKRELVNSKIKSDGLLQEDTADHKVQSQLRKHSESFQ